MMMADGGLITEIQLVTLVSIHLIIIDNPTHHTLYESPVL
jgi:hypothetical protein